MRESRSLRARQPPRPEEFPHPVCSLHEDNMRLPLRWAAHRRVFLLVVFLLLFGLTMVFLSLMDSSTSQDVKWKVNPAHRKRMHAHVHSVLEGPCRSSGTRQGLLARLPASSHMTQAFLWRDDALPDDLFRYPPPFGFLGMQRKVENLLKLMPDFNAAPQPEKTSAKCSRCVVVGNGGILKGQELGSLLDRFDTIIRLNSGPVGEFSVDVGNRTTIRMSYPEGTPLHWADPDPQALFVAVVYKGVDISWISAMINKQTVSLWDWLFFWKKVPDQIPVDPSRFRLLDPRVIKEVAVDLLKYPLPRPRLWSWDQNVPTLGVSALNLASLLCDEVSLAGFGYDLSQEGAPPLHYYDQLPMSKILKQKMHNVDREGELLQSLVREGTISDLTGGIHCSFCPS